MPLIDLNPNRSSTSNDIPVDAGFVAHLWHSYTNEPRSALSNRLWFAVIIVWIAASTVPTFFANTGHQVPDLASRYAASILMLATTLVTLACMWKWRTVVLVSAVILVMSWLLASVGVTSGIPYGPYRAIGSPEPLFAGMSLLIGVPWLMMLPAAWGTADMILERDRDWVSRLKFAALSGIVLAAWGITQVSVADSTRLSNFGYCIGIPCFAIAGWILAAATLTVAVRPLRIPRFRLAIVYALSVVLEPFSWGDHTIPSLPMFVGLSAMVVTLMAGIWIEHRRVAASRSG